MSDISALTDAEIGDAPDGTPAAEMAAAWWAWHDQDISVRSSATMSAAIRRCAAWVRGESDDGPDRNGLPAASRSGHFRPTEELR